MNALFNSALRQSTSIRKDLGALVDAPNASSAPLQGQLNASLTSFSRTIDDYNRMAQQEPVPTKQEKAFERVKSFRLEMMDYREQLERVKKDHEVIQSSQNRSELLGRRPHQTATPENPYANNEQYAAHNGPFRPSGNVSAFGASNTDYNRETHAMREQSFMSSANSQLDEFLDRGRAVLGDLGNQRELLKGTQKRLYGAANTLGISGETIRMVERRAKQDKWIFWAGVVIFFTFCFLVLRWLR